MASADALEDDRDSSLPASALSPAEYRSFRAFVLELHHAAGGSLNKLTPLDAVTDFLTSFYAVNHTVAQQVQRSASGLTRRFVIAWLGGSRARVSRMARSMP
jgi:hypothetical protein